MKKKGLEFSFAWFFAILVGAVILFLAIYAAMRFVGMGEYQEEAATAKQLTVIFESLETGLAVGKSSEAIVFQEESRIYNKCYPDEFGKHKISISSRSSIGGDWQKPGPALSVPNKYIFSDNVTEGKKIYLFSKSFEMPFKVSEIIFLTAENYCFVNNSNLGMGVPEYIENEIHGLGLQNIKSSNLIDCKEEDIKVCFGNTVPETCDIQIIGQCITGCRYDYEGYDYGIVIKNGRNLFYEGSLIYGAIFSHPDIYECNVQRLMYRLSKQALLYAEESNFIQGRIGCGATTSAGLVQLSNMARTVVNPQELFQIRNIAKLVDEQNDGVSCRLW